MKEVLVFDFDGLLVNSQLPMIQKVHERTGRLFTFEEWTHFEALHTLTTQLTNTTIDEVCEWLNADEVILKAQPTPGAQEAVEYLTARKKKILIATSRPEEQREATLSTMAEFFPQLRPENLYLRPHGVNGATFKWQVTLEHKAIALVEDSAELLLKIHAMRKHSRIMLILQDKPWNYLIQTPRSNFMRIGNWQKDDGGWRQLIRWVNRISR